MTDQGYSGDERWIDKEKDDMASRRVSSHIPAPLRKKKIEDQYKKFITPTGNTVAYLQQHMRSKSMSDLSEEKKEEENQRAQINHRYDEMDKLKVLLREEEDTWTSKLQSWKTRRRSVTEDARKRKEERDHLEKEVEIKTGRRKRKTYKEIVEDKMRRDKELALLNDHDEYEFVSPRSSTVTSPIGSTVPSKYSFDAALVATVREKEKSMDPKDDFDTETTNDDVFSNKYEASVKPLVSVDNPQVQYKYTTKVTAVINNDSPVEQEQSGDKKQPQMRSTITHDLAPMGKKGTSRSTVAHTVSGSRTLPRDFSKTDKAVNGFMSNKPTQSEKSHSPISPRKVETQTKSTIPNVLMRAKNPNARRERPKSTHDLPTGSSSSLPRNYHDYSTPKPFTAGPRNFTKYRKTAFANRWSMWENMGKSEGHETPSQSEQPSSAKHERNLSDEFVISAKSKGLSTAPNYSSKNQERNPFKNDPPTNGEFGVRKPIDQSKVQKFDPKPAPSLPQSKTSYPAKVPLVTSTRRPVLTTGPRLEKYATIDVPATQTATLSVSGLSITSPRLSKTATLPVPTKQHGEPDALFDDMKICINQRPRSEKGFGFTVRGGDDGKPVIVDTVSQGGAADICQLCVSDEILAINEVPLAECKTQDDIVQLIVSSVITGNLSLNIRRYGKGKKSSPLRLSGTKVVMTPGGFVQVRSDKPTLGTPPARTSYNSKLQGEISLPSPVHKDNNNNNEEYLMDEDLPPPPSQQELDAVHYSNSSNRSGSPLSNLVSAAHNQHEAYPSIDGSFEQGSSADSYLETALSEVHSGRGDNHEDEEDLRRQVLEAQKALDFEQVNAYDTGKHAEETQLRLKLQEEQRKLDQEEAQRDEARRKQEEEARLEDLRVEEELRKIEARKVKQQQQRRAEMEHLQNTDQKRAPNQVPNIQQRTSRTNGLGRMGGQHWMIEEAERRRVAEQDGKFRSNTLPYGRKSDSRSGSGLPDHVIQKLTNRTSKTMGPRPYSKETTPFWNDPNAKATLL